MAEVDGIAPRKTEAPNPQTDPGAVDQLARGSELIFLGSVETFGPSPTHWSGHFVSYQEVHYRVHEVVKGEAPHDEIVVRHVVVKNSPTAEPGDVPGLSSKLFSQGARLMVMGVADAQGRWISMSERLGALPRSPEVVEQVRAAILA